jgi:hypothetical protein
LLFEDRDDVENARWLATRLLHLLDAIKVFGNTAAMAFRDSPCSISHAKTYLTIVLPRPNGYSLSPLLQARRTITPSQPSGDAQKRKSRIGCLRRMQTEEDPRKFTLFQQNLWMLRNLTLQSAIA